LHSLERDSDLVEVYMHVSVLTEERNYV